MKKGVIIIGVIVSIIGFILILFMWPLIGTITWDELDDTDMKDGETYKVQGKVTNKSPPMGVVIYEIEDGEYILITDQDTMNEGDSVIVEFTYDEEIASGFDNQSDRPSMLDAMDAKVYRVPTPLGLIGLMALILGVIIIIAGVITGRAASKTIQLPLEQPPLQQPPPGQPPQQPPE
jgi:hypothetical protein